jgi:hypothetical protein
LGEVTLTADLDVEFLVVAYSHLPEFTRGDNEHDVWLGDGIIHVIAKRSGDAVQAVCTHFPHLNKALARSVTYRVSLQQYLSAWSRLIEGVFDLRRLERA